MKIFLYIEKHPGNLSKSSNLPITAFVVCSACSISIGGKSRT